MIFLERLLFVLKEKNISQAEASSFIGMPLRTLQDWLGGRRHPPEWVLLLVIDKLLNY